MGRYNTPAIVNEIAESDLPSKKALLKALGDIKDEAEVFHSQVLVVGYIHPAKTKGGIITTDNARAEDQWQGTIGLVIKLGPGAFKDDSVAKFHGKKLKEGDWVMYRAADGVSLHIRGVPCKLFQDTNILMRVSDPILYW